MNTTLRFDRTFVVLLLLFSSAASAWAQAQPTTPVAVVDIGHIFKNYPRFTQAMESVKSQAKTTDAKLVQRRDAIQAKLETLKSYKSESVEYKSLEKEIAHLQAELEADRALKRKELLEKEAKIYYIVYNEIQQQVKTFADTHGIGLVLRFSTEQMEPTNRTSVMQGVNRPVVYQRNLNITYDVLDRLKRATSRTAQSPRSTTGGNRNATAPRRR